MKELGIISLVLGMIGTNVYIAYDRDTKRCFIVDPADSAENIISAIEENGLKPEAVLLTHGHFDHIMAVDELRRKYGIRVFAGEKEKELLSSPELNSSVLFTGKPAAVSADVYLGGNEEFIIADRKIRCINTPGHTKGSVCFYIESDGLLFSGDTLFCESFGRTDLAGGSMREIISSISERLFTLPDAVTVYPGHMEPTSIGHEKLYNPIAMYK